MYVINFTRDHTKVVSLTIDGVKFTHHPDGRALRDIPTQEMTAILSSYLEGVPLIKKTNLSSVYGHQG